MRSAQKISHIVAQTCATIDSRLNGRSHPKENEIIAEECRINHISEKHIRKVRKMNEYSKKYKEMKG